VQEAGRSAKGAERVDHARWLWPAAAISVAVTAYLNWITVSTIWTAKSEIPLRDQWPFLDDVRAILAGEHPASRLWSCYWGHRPVITRLITLADVRWFFGSNTPLIALNLLFQTGHAVLLAYVAWRVFRHVSWPLFLLIAAVIFEFSLSALQMENLIWAAQIGYVLTAAAATLAFFLLALYPGQAGDASGKAGALLAGCFFAALVSSLSRPDGILAWPVLVVQACALRLKMRVRILLALAACAVAGAYFWKYEAGPPLGMGVAGTILHPLQSLPILAMLVVEPFSVLSSRAGVWLGAVSLLFAGYAWVKVLGPRSRSPAMISVFGAVALFSLATMSTIVMGRVSPAFIAARGKFPLFPSRYSASAFLFWAGMIGISAWLLIHNRRTWPQFAAIGSMTFALSFGTAFWQVGEARNWRAYITELDVAGTALVLGVHDPSSAALDAIYPDVPLRWQIRDWLQRNRLSFFREPRAHLMGSGVSSGSANASCEGHAETPVRVDEGLVRGTGWVWDSRANGAPRDLVFVDGSGRVVGLARSGLRRPDLRGKVPEKYLEDSGWQGYIVNPGKGSIGVYGVIAGKNSYCRVSEIPGL